MGFALRRIQKKVPVQAKAAMVYTLASFITRGFHIITTPIFTRIMTVEQIGVISNYSTWYSFISIVATLGLTANTVNIALKEFKDDRIGYLKSAQTLMSCGVVLTGIITALLYPVIDTILGLSAAYLVLMFICMLFSGANNFWMSWQRYEYRYRAVGIVTIASSILSAGIAVIAVIVAKNNGIEDLATVRLYASSAVTLCFSIPFFLFFLFQKKALINKKYIRFSLCIGLPLLVHSLAKTALSASDRVMINAICGEKDLGYYSALYTLSSLMLIVWDAINASLVPYIFDRLDKGADGEKEINKISVLLLLVFAGCSFLWMLFAPEIIWIIASEKYLSAVYVTPPIATGVFFISLYSLYSNLIMYQKKTNYIMFSTMGAAIFNLVTNYIFIKEFGYIAAAYTTLASYLLLAIIYKFVSKKVSGHSIYAEKKIWSIAIGVLILCIICNFLYKYTILRYAVIAAMCILIAVFHKRLIWVIRFMLKKNNTD